ncbi:Chorismate mutase I / Prephenate dehydratase [hydrothermal vent metagenome]|uniref:Bifunctional chorismate mutase/prephenate dehydratase n=1 Tax=hydrothermal vent metagenome TaxID=652676 RepID=A0A3B1BFD7_9ZZZZ
MSDEQQLKAIRSKINGLDEEIQRLISERAEAAQVVARIKLAGDSDTEFYRPEREADVLRKVKARNQGPLDDEEIARLFREIMSACLALEQPMKIAFLGPSGTFTQAAALKHFGHSVKTQSVDSISEVFREVESGDCHYGVVPVENSTEGVVTHTLDMFLNSPLRICGEVSLRINHHLLGVGGIEQIQTVYSHQQSLAQCRGWLDLNLPKVKRVSVGSNAEAAKLAAADQNAAAIASEAAADIYSLKLLSQNIEDEPGNTTRFLVIGKQEVPACGADKTSLLLATRNVAGGLHRLLAPLAEHGVSMTRIESRPSRRGKWEYVFFVDIDGHKDDPIVAQALERLIDEAQVCKVLGSYPKAVL